MQQQPTRKRSKNTKRDPSKIKPKFQEQRQQEIERNPLRPLNGKQKYYIELLETKDIVVATGYAGSSKTYCPTVMACDKFRLGEINKIIFTRPAVSTSKSLGYFSGSAIEKASMWLGGVIPILKDRLGVAPLEIALTDGDIEYLPLEVIKGMSINDAWLIVEEASDLTKEEVIKIITRMGKNSKLVLAGDVRQSELKQELGLVWLSKFIQRHNMSDNFGFVDFNQTSDIVRSESVKKFITALLKDEKSKEV